MRDTTATESRVRDAMKDFDTVLAGANAGNLNQATVGYGVAMVRGAYTLGESREACEARGTRVVDLYLDWVAASNGSLAWYLFVDQMAELVGTAVLCGKSEQLFRSLHGATWVQAPDAWEQAVFDPMVRAFGGQAPGAGTPSHESAPIPKARQRLVSMLSAIIEKDAREFGDRLADFLLAEWGPASEKGAKSVLSSRWPLYTGKWSLLAAAACRRMGAVPNLPVRAHAYFPRELV